MTDMEKECIFLPGHLIMLFQKAQITDLVTAIMIFLFPNAEQDVFYGLKRRICRNKKAPVLMATEAQPQPKALGKGSNSYISLPKKYHQSTICQHFFI
ncbi:MAG: hypothetical protein KAR45_06720 [Desulfobacteraceae bacterium]|nr:hypothetical protein [Desulfobacteraceae bacterium]